MSGVLAGLQEYENEYAERLYYMPPGPEREIGFWPLNAGRMVAKPNYKSGPKRSPFYSMHFVLSGQALLEFGGQCVLLDEGDVFCRFPNETVQISLAPPNANLRMAWLSFHGETVLSLMQYIGLTHSRPFVRQAAQEQFPELLQQMFLEFRRLPEGGNYLKFIGIVYELFGLLALSVRKQTEKGNQPVSWLQQSLDFMAMHYTEGITVQNVADYVNLNRSHFSTSFAEQCGMTPIQYLQQLRMRSAVKMLRETDYTVTDVALSLGYPDLYTFTKAFRKFYGVSPSQYRETGQTPGPNP